MVVTVENMHHVPGQVIQNYKELLGLVEPLNNPALQITLDMGHADRADGITEALDVFSSYLRHIHIHDSNGKRDHLEIGLGELDRPGLGSGHHLLPLVGKAAGLPIHHGIGVPKQ